MAPKAATWIINREVFDKMLRHWFSKTRCDDDPKDLKVLDFGMDLGPDGQRKLIALVEFVGGGGLQIEPGVKAEIDKIVAQNG